MVTYLRIKIHKTRTPAATSFGTPKGYDRDKIQVLAYEDHPDRLGEVVEDCIAQTLDDAYAAEFAKHPDVEILTEADAIRMRDEYRPPPPEVRVTLRGKGKDHRTAIEALLKGRGATYRIEEA